MRSRSGFTLLELLMVVIIIGILASIALPQYIRATERARATEALSMLGALRSAEVRYKAQADDNVYTADETELDADIPATLKSWDSLTIDDAAGTAFFVRISGTNAGEELGIFFDTGDLCGTFGPYFGANATPPPCS